MKKAMFLLFLCLFMSIPIASYATNCEDLVWARESAIKERLSRGQEAARDTVNAPSKNLKDLSCNLESFTSNVDMMKYDQAAIMSWLKKLGDSAMEKGCSAAEDMINSNLRQISSAANSAGNLPYGLGRVYDTSLSTSGVSINAKPSVSTGGVMSNVPSVPRYNLPF